MVVFDVFIFLVVLGALIFFHELGHFLAAKACGIYCNRFSLGIPPRVWGFRWGETDYCIGALPIGGYLKMAGQEDAPRSEEKRESEYKDVPVDRWFSSKPVWQRTIVILAGPAMNFALGIILYGVVAAVGSEVPETKVDNRVGAVMPGSPAGRAPLYLMTSEDEGIDRSRPDAVGWQTGDRIVSIDGEPTTNITDVAIEAVLGTGKTMHAEIERTTEDGAVLRYISPVMPEILGDEEHPRFGVDPFITALIGVVMDGMPAQAHGIQPGDIIVRANGKLVDTQTFTRLVEGMTHAETLEMQVQQEDKMLEISLQPRVVGRFMGLGTRPYLPRGPGETVDTTPPQVIYCSEELREKTGLKPKDVILEVEGQRATAALLREMEQTRVGETIEVKVHRPAIFFGLAQQEEVRTVHLEVEPVGAIGIVWAPKMVYYRVPASRVIPEAFRLGYQALARTVRTVGLLITGSVSPKDLGGPVMIFQATAAAARMGFLWLLEMTAFISVNLCVINLVPLSVLDGGHVVFLAIEGIRRKPMDVRVLERINQVGLVFIIGLMLFVTYNDVFRLVKSIIP